MSFSAPCSREFLPAAHTSGTREPSDVHWIVLHDEEAPTARGAAAYFRSIQSGGSAHLCVDGTSCYRCLDNHIVPWGASSCIAANLHGFHIEQAGYARWSSVLWFNHRKTLQRAAYKTAVHCKAFGIPVRFVPAMGLPELHGITTHAEITKASKRLDPAHAWWYTHTDPGRLWPRRWFMHLVRRYHATL